jgi:hypothetical protein
MPRVWWCGPPGGEEGEERKGAMRVVPGLSGVQSWSEAAGLGWERSTEPVESLQLKSWGWYLGGNKVQC